MIPILQVLICLLFWLPCTGSRLWCVYLCLGTSSSTKFGKHALRGCLKSLEIMISYHKKQSVAIDMLSYICNIRADLINRGWVNFPKRSTRIMKPAPVINLISLSLITYFTVSKICPRCTIATTLQTSPSFIFKRQPLRRCFPRSSLISYSPLPQFWLLSLYAAQNISWVLLISSLDHPTHCFVNFPRRSTRHDQLARWWCCSISPAIRRCYCFYLCWKFPEPGTSYRILSRFDLSVLITRPPCKPLWTVWTSPPLIPSSLPQMPTWVPMAIFSECLSASCSLTRP